MSREGWGVPEAGWAGTRRDGPGGPGVLRESEVGLGREGDPRVCLSKNTDFDSDFTTCSAGSGFVLMFGG